MNLFVDWFRKTRLVLLVGVIWIILDQITKELVRNNIPLHSSVQPIPALGEAFVFEHVNNYGAAFGILQNQGNFFVVIAVVVVTAILFYVRTLPPEQRFVRFLLGLQFGGAIGNLIDRLQRGYVTDFVRMGIPNVYYYPNYNVADSGIVLGVIGLGIYIIVEDIRTQRKAKQAQAEIQEA
ncbi:MAG: signal peptidase II [Caldilineaceae bacterium]